MNSVYAMPADEAAAELVRLQACADQHRADALDEPSDEEFIELLAIAFSMHPAAVVARIRRMDLDAAEERFAA